MLPHSSRLSLVGTALLLIGALLSAPAAHAQPKPAPPLKVGIVHIGPVSDGGWARSHDLAREAIEREFSARIRTTSVEMVPDGGDSERVMRDLAAQGNTLIFGTSFGYGPSILKLAADNPGVKFEHATGYKTAANVRVFDSRAYEAGYMAGIVAAGMSKTKVLGAVGSMPIPSVIRMINAFALGAQSVDPAVTVRVVWINDWHNPPKEGEAAQSLLNGGADVLLQTADSPAVLTAAERAGKYAFGLHTDQRSFGPRAHLGSIVSHWGPYYVKAVREALDGSWTTGQTWWGVAEGAVDLVGVPGSVPAETRARVDAVRKALKARSFAMWKGPLLDSKGKTMLAAGQSGDDAFLLSMLTYVKGVEGRLPDAGK